VVGDHTAQLALVNHQEVMNIVPDHLQECLETVITRFRFDQGHTHDISYAVGQRPFARHYLVSEVPVRNNAGRKEVRIEQHQ